MKQNILFVLAHPDDEAYGPGGTIAKLVTEHNVKLITLSNGARPGSEHVSHDRRKALSRSCELLGVDFEQHNAPELKLQHRAVTIIIEQTIHKFKPTIVYTNNISDINVDHRVTAESCLIACRPKPQSTIKRLYFCEILPSTSWTFGQIQPSFEPNTFVDISPYITIKQQALSFYQTEIYDFPDARSVEAITSLAKVRGSQIGVPYAEAHKLVFAID